MFSGIVEELGTIRERTDTRLVVEAHAVLTGARVGDSIAVSGCCLTIASLQPGAFTADVMPETLRRTTLGALAAGDAVNLEASLRFNDRVGGHLVTGHVDATGSVDSVAEEGNARRVTITAPATLLELVAPQGSIAVDGISLTVVDVQPGAFTVSLIPHTTMITTAGRWTIGSRVNLEVDLIARYIRRAMQAAAETVAHPAGDTRSGRHAPASLAHIVAEPAGRSDLAATSADSGVPSRLRYGPARRGHHSRPPGIAAYGA